MELSTLEAGTAIGVSRETIRLDVVAGRLPARKHGIRGALKIELDALRQFARAYGYQVDEEYLSRLAIRQ